jgi:site-specific DNA-methyltransferase (cytosine-N4-specific)
VSLAAHHPPAPAAAAAGVLAGDAFDLVKDLGESSVDVILTSPPYWGLRSYGIPHDVDVLSIWEASGCSSDRVPPYDWYRDAGGALGAEPYPQWYIEHLVEFFGRCKRALKDGGSLWVNLGDTYFARWSSIRDGGRQGYLASRGRRRTPSGGYLRDKQLLLIPARFAISMQESGWILRNDLIWSKPIVMPRPERDRLRLSHEHWFHFVKRPRTGRASYYYDLSEAEEGALDVVAYRPAQNNEGHSATFPADLVRPRIASTCPVGGLVVDPFCGTGTTMVEAIRLGRRGIGFELQGSFARAARKALLSVCGEIHAGDAGAST